MFATESAPGPAITGITGGYLLKTIVALVCVLVIFVVLALLTKRLHRYGQSQHRDLSVLSSMSVGTRERLMVVQVGEAQLLLGVTPSRIDNLFVLDTPLRSGIKKEDPLSDISLTATDRSAVNFRAKLNQFIGKNGSPV